MSRRCPGESPAYRCRSKNRPSSVVHGETERFESAKLGPRRPVAHQVRVRDQDAGRPLVGLEDADRSAGLHQHRLVALQGSQRSHQRVETSPVARRAPGAAVDDEVIGPFGRPRGRGCSATFEGRPLGPSRGWTGWSRGRLERDAHLPCCSPTSAVTKRWTISSSSPLRTSSPTAAISGDSHRSCPGPPETALTRSLTAPVTAEGVSGQAQREGPRTGQQFNGQHVGEGVEGRTKFPGGVPPHGGRDPPASPTKESSPRSPGRPGASSPTRAPPGRTGRS